MIHIGTAGWSIPKQYVHLFPADGTHLQRYASRFAITEINQTFYKLPRPSTLQKWVDSTPAHFRFCVKLHRSFTHFHKLKSTDGLKEFIDTIEHLGSKLYALLVQLPPSLKFDKERAKSFFVFLQSRFHGYLVLEARHESWQEAEDLLKKLQITRVAADPARFGSDNRPGGYEDFVYYRLHGSPKIYYSEYSKDFLQELADFLLTHPAKEKVVIFDNTASGAAIKNALELMEIVHETQ